MHGNTKKQMQKQEKKCLVTFLAAQEDTFTGEDNFSISQFKDL